MNIVLICTAIYIVSSILSVIIYRSVKSDPFAFLIKSVAFVPLFNSFMVIMSLISILVDKTDFSKLYDKIFGD